MGGGGDLPPRSGASPAADSGGDGIRVAVRVRPFLPHESGTSSCVEVLPHANQISIGRSIAQPDSEVVADDKKTFTFDHALPGSSPQSAVYESCVSSLITACLGGFNTTTLAYGQTGAGKTYTILGPGAGGAAGADEGMRAEVGIIPRALSELFQRLEGRRAEEEGTFEYDVKLQFLELYGEEVRDLLSAPAGGSGSRAVEKPKAPKLIIRDTGSDAEVLGATSTPVKAADEALLCLTRGMLRRVVGATAMNAESSRSHAMMTVLVEQRIKDETGGTEVRKSKYNFVDLAGSERSKRTGAKGKRLKEGIDINKGLLVLGNVISALSSPDPRKRKFVPFRDSKLTRLLRGSLGGNHKTLLIACVSPSARNLEESLNCLRYANRAKNIRNKTSKASSGTVGGDPAVAKLLAELRGQVGALAAELLRVRRGGDPVPVGEGGFTTEQLETLAKGHDGGGSSASGAEREPLPTPAAAEPPKSKEEDGTSSSESDKPLRIAADAEKVADGSPTDDRPPPQSRDGDAAAATSEALRKAERDLAERTERLAAAEAERDALREKLCRMEEEAAAAESAEEAAKGELQEEKKDEGVAAAVPSGDAPRRALDGEEEEEGRTTFAPDGGAASPQALNEEEGAPTAASAIASPVVTEDVLTAIVERIVAYQREAEAIDRKSRRSRQPPMSQTSSYCSNQSSPSDDEITDADEGWAVGTECSEATPSLMDWDEEEADAELNKSRCMSTIKPHDPADDFASAMYRTGLFLVEHEDYKSSLPCFEVALSIRRERFGWEDPTVGDVLYMEGLVRGCTRDHDRALLLLYDALRIRRIHADSLNAAATLRTIGDLHVSKGEYELADAFYEESLQEANACQDDSIPDILFSLAKVKKKLGMLREALACFEEVLRLCDDRFGPDDPRSFAVAASLLYEVGILSFQLGEYKQGEQRLRNFVRVRKQQGVGPHFPDPRVARAFYALGNYSAVEMHDAVKAGNYWCEALQIYQAGLADDHPHIVALRDSIKRAAELASPRWGGLKWFERRKSNEGEAAMPIVVPDVRFHCTQAR